MSDISIKSLLKSLERESNLTLDDVTRDKLQKENSDTITKICRSNTRLMYSQISLWIKESASYGTYVDSEKIDRVKESLENHINSFQKSKSVTKNDEIKCASKILDHILIIENRNDYIQSMHDSLNRGVDIQSDFLRQELDSIESKVYNKMYEEQSNSLLKSHASNITFLGIFTAIIFSFLSGINFFTIVIPEIGSLYEVTNILKLILFSIIYLHLIADVLFVLMCFIKKTIDTVISKNTVGKVVLLNILVILIEIIITKYIIC